MAKANSDKLLTEIAEAICPDRDDIMVWRFYLEGEFKDRIIVQLARTSQSMFFDLPAGDDIEAIRANLAMCLAAMTTPVQGEINPHHPVTAGMRDQYHKLLALLMLQRGEKRVEFPLAEIERLMLGANDINVLVEDKMDRLIIRLVTLAEAKEIARKTGGLLV